MSFIAAHILSVNTSYALQLTAVAIILLGCLLWLTVSIKKHFKSKGGTASCSGCALASACNKVSARNRVLNDSPKSEKDGTFN
jgi:uncharacterized membrane protein